MNEIVLIVIAYLIGSIPTAVWVSKFFFGIDIRDYGSGNSGATNTYRVLGAKWGTFVMIVDMAKAIAAVKLAFLPPKATKQKDKKAPNQTQPTKNKTQCPTPLTQN